MPLRPPHAPTLPATPGPAVAWTAPRGEARARELVERVVAGLEAVACTWSRAGWEHGAHALAILLRHPDAPPRAWAERRLLPLLRADLAASLERFERRAPAWSAEAFSGALTRALAEAWPDDVAAREARALQAALRAAGRLPAADGRLAPPRPAGPSGAGSVVALARASLPRTLRFVQRELSGPGRRTLDAEQALRLREVATPARAIGHVLAALLLARAARVGGRRERAAAQALRGALGVVLAHPEVDPARLPRGGADDLRPADAWSADALTRALALALTASDPRRRVDVAAPLPTWDLGAAQPLLHTLLDLTALRAWGLLA